MGSQDLKNQFNLRTFVLVFSKEQQVGKNKKRCTLKGENRKPGQVLPIQIPDHLW